MRSEVRASSVSELTTFSMKGRDQLQNGPNKLVKKRFLRRGQRYKPIILVEGPSEWIQYARNDKKSLLSYDLRTAILIFHFCGPRQTHQLMSRPSSGPYFNLILTA